MRLALGAIAGLALGLGLGFLKAKTRYEVSLELIKRYAQPTFQFGINGEPYKPRQFTSATLASAASSPNVLERVARRAGNGISAGMLKASISVKEDRITDFVTLTLSGYQSADATVELAKLWTEEVVSFTREMQSLESREIRKVLQTQLMNNESELERLDLATLKISGGDRLLAADMQVDSYLRSQSDADSKYELVKMELDAANSKIQGVRGELQHQTPVAEELRAARAELEQYRSRYTDQNPLVLDRVEKVAALEAQLKNPSKTPASTDVNSLSGTFVSNALYLRLVELENQRDALEQHLRELQKKRDQFKEAPEDSSHLMEMLQKKQTMRTAQSLLLSRMQEVRLYEENPPAFYGVFAPADLDRVSTKPKSMKVAVYGTGGLFAGAALTLFGILLAGFVDPKLRTAGEAAKTLGVPLYAALRTTANPDERSEKGARLWARWIGGSVGAPRARVVWSPALDASENDFWTMMIAEARKLVPGLIVVNCGADTPPAFASLPQSTDISTENIVTTNFPIAGGSLAHVQELRELIDLWLAGGSEVWVRIAGPVQEPATTLARDLGAALLLVPLHRTESRYWRQQAELFRHSGTQPSGLVVLNEIPLSQADEKPN